MEDTLSSHAEHLKEVHNDLFRALYMYGLQVYSAGIWLMRTSTDICLSVLPTTGTPTLGDIFLLILAAETTLAFTVLSVRIWLYAVWSFSAALIWLCGIVDSLLTAAPGLIFQTALLPFNILSAIGGAFYAISLSLVGAAEAAILWTGSIGLGLISMVLVIGGFCTFAYFLVMNVEYVHQSAETILGTVMIENIQAEVTGRLDATSLHNMDSMNQSTEKDKIDMLCITCMDKPRKVVTLPCKHMCLCEACAKQIMIIDPLCPLCREPIRSMLHVYT